MMQRKENPQGKWFGFIPGGLDHVLICSETDDELKGGRRVGDHDMKNEEVGALAWKKEWNG